MLYSIYTPTVSIGTFMIPFTILAVSLLILYFVHFQRTKMERERSAEQRQYQKTIEDLYLETRAFRHNRKNMLIAIGGYLTSGNYDDLRRYIGELTAKSGIDDDFSAADGIAELRDDGLKALFISKYLECKNRQVSFRLLADESFSVDIRMGVLIELLGILIDNAIDSAAESGGGQVIVKLTALEGQVAEVANTFSEPPDVSQIFTDGYTTKTGHSGFGLYRLRQILRQHKKLGYSAEILDTFFIFRLLG